MDGSDHGAGPIDLPALAEQATVQGAVWSLQSADLNVNLVVLDEGEGVAAHVNTEVDVLLVGIAGEGLVEVEGGVEALAGGQALLIPKGTRRAIRSAGGRFAY